jgi:type I restriction enzyme, S subunit
MNLEVASLESICKLISSGGTPARQHPEYFAEPPNGHLWVKSKELLDAPIDATEERISDLGLAKSAAKYFPPGTVLVAMYGANVGQLAWLRDAATVNQAICGLVVDETKAHSRYVFYSLLLNRGDLIVQAQGAAQQNLNQGQVRRFAIPLHSLGTQERIAAVLSAYDDFIENCQRRIHILETIARALYREWFVDFRFPGYERASFIQSPLGLLPEGWGGKFSDLAHIDRDAINPIAFPEEEFDHFSIPAFDEGRQPATENGATILSAKYQIDGSVVLLSKLNPRIPRVWLPEVRKDRCSITSTEFLVLKPQGGATKEFVYAKCTSEQFRGEFANLANGTSTSHQRVKPENLLALPTVVPDVATIEHFTAISSPMLSLAQRLRSQVSNLRRTRDLLLPRLMSGQLTLDSE